ncbi:MAG TPA: phosphatase PAP2 family protein [Bacillota bacterium]|nr:phosphatase PAP2 family protein [Bacillota bacterium]
MIKQLFKKYKHFSYALVFIALHAVFFWLELTIEPKYYMERQIDSYIPFIKYFVVAYVSWHLYVFAVPIYFGFKSKKHFYEVCTFMALGTAISIIIFYLFPNGQGLRPEIVETDVFSRLIGLIYYIDTPTNVAPSMHVIHAVAVHIALVKYEPFARRKALPIASFIVMVLVSLSTLFIKQHAVLDVLLSILVCGFLYVMVYVLAPKIIKSRAQKGEYKKQAATEKN